MSDNPRFYRTRIDAGQTVSELVDIIRKHGASSVTTQFNGSGVPVGIAFIVDVPEVGPVPVSMSAQIDGIQERLTSGSREQARNTAWRQLKMLVELQLELVANGVKDFHEMFAGDVLTEDGRTVGQRMGELMAPLDRGGVRLLPPGRSER